MSSVNRVISSATSLLILGSGQRRTVGQSSTCAWPQTKAGATRIPASVVKDGMAPGWQIFNEGLAKVAENYLRKGSKVYIEGQLQTRKMV